MEGERERERIMRGGLNMYEIYRTGQPISRKICFKGREGRKEKMEEINSNKGLNLLHI